MPTYQVRITGAADAAPETAAVRLIARLPAPWGATLLSCALGTATLTLTVPRTLSPEQVSEAVDAVLATPELRGWAQEGAATRHPGDGDEDRSSRGFRADDAGPVPPSTGLPRP
ncbi:hypothetical protein [Kitasatospora sp. NPDC101183]|uniref:hypothetical protein n=1 Tax=Kitasatospora sp. NPDC101183 TaxID=3364100 RepID=UPI003825CA80